MQPLLHLSRSIARLFSSRARWERLAAADDERADDRPQARQTLLGCSLEWGTTLLPVEGPNQDPTGRLLVVITYWPGAYLQVFRPEGSTQFLFMERPGLGPAARAQRDHADDVALVVRDDRVRFEALDEVEVAGLDTRMLQAVDMMLALCSPDDDALAEPYLAAMRGAGSLDPADDLDGAPLADQPLAAAAFLGHCLERLMSSWGRETDPAQQAAEFVRRSGLRRRAPLGALAGLVLRDISLLTAAVNDERLEDGLRVKALLLVMTLLDPSESWRPRAALIRKALLTGKGQLLAAGARAASDLPPDLAAELLETAMGAHRAAAWGPIVDALETVGEKLLELGPAGSERSEVVAVPLLRAVEKARSDVRARASRSLAKLGAHESLQKKLFVLLEGARGDQAFAIAELGRHGTIAAIAPLRAVAEGPDSPRETDRRIKESILQIQSRASGDVGGLSVLASDDEEQGRLALADRGDGGLAFEDDEGD